MPWVFFFFFVYIYLVSSSKIIVMICILYSSWRRWTWWEISFWTNRRPDRLIRCSFFASRLHVLEHLKDDVDGTKDLNIRLILRMKTICCFSCLIRPYRLVHSLSPQALNPSSTISLRATASRKTSWFIFSRNRFDHWPSLHFHLLILHIQLQGMPYH